MRIRVCADSTCDLSGELCERFGIRIVPLHVIMGEVSHLDGADCTVADVFAYTEKTGELCSTAAVSIGEYLDYFSRELESCDAVVHISMSSALSSCYQNAAAAALDLPGRVFVVDSLSLTTGMGLLVIECAEKAAAGEMTAEELAAFALERRENIRVSFMPDSLEYLRKGGRCSALAVLGANALKLRPCIEMKNGTLGVGKKYRGTSARAFSAYLSDLLADTEHIDRRRCVFSHALTDPAQAEKYLGQVRSCGVFEEVLVSPAGTTIAVHSGPEVVGLFFFAR